MGCVAMNDAVVVTYGVEAEEVMQRKSSKADFDGEVACVLPRGCTCGK